MLVVIDTPLVILPNQTSSRLTSYIVAVQQRILRGVGVLSPADARGHTQQVLVLVRSTVVQPYRVY